MRGGAAVGAVIGIAALAGGCLSSGDCAGAGQASASCAAGIEYDGHFYVAWSDRLPASRGELLGDGEYPGACDDGGDSCGEAEAGAAAEPVRVWTLPGAPPDQVVVARSQGRPGLVVYGRLHADADDYFRFTRGAWHLRRP
jgi:hypothetical protein